MEMDKHAEQVEKTAEETAKQQEQPTQEQQEQEEKLFTQDELDAIVKKRLDRERKRMELLTSDSDTMRQKLYEREKAITERELRADARERLMNEGLPTGFADAIDCSSADACDKALAKIIKELSEISKKHTAEIFKANSYTPQANNHHFYSGPNNDPLREAFKPKER